MILSMTYINSFRLNKHSNDFSSNMSVRESSVSASDHHLEPNKERQWFGFTLHNKAQYFANYVRTLILLKVETQQIWFNT